MTAQAAELAQAFQQGAGNWWSGGKELRPLTCPRPVGLGVKYVAAGVKSVLSNLKARRTWENHIGPILTHKQAVDATGWTKQNLSQAVREHRVLRLTAADGTVGYWREGLSDTAPHVPILGIKDVLKAWVHAAVEPWTIASWMSSPQPELAGRTPRQALIDGEIPVVVTLARQASERLAS